jgi:hypothetical protein
MGEISVWIFFGNLLIKELRHFVSKFTQNIRLLFGLIKKYQRFTFPVHLGKVWECLLGGGISISRWNHLSRHIWENCARSWNVLGRDIKGEIRRRIHKGVR